MFSVFRMKGPRNPRTAILWTNLVVATESLTSIGTNGDIGMVSREWDQKIRPYLPVHFVSPLTPSRIFRTRRGNEGGGKGLRKGYIRSSVQSRPPAP